MNRKEKWNAVLTDNGEYDGTFFYAVKSTRIFCRPSCPSKPPLEENVTYFPTAEAAMNAGYRPCKRCRPDLLAYQPTAELAGKIKTAIDLLFADRAALFEELKKLGISRRHMTQLFVNHYGQTPGEYANALRIQTAKEQLKDQSHSILDIAFSLGFESLSSFYRFFRKYTETSPGDYRQQYQSTHRIRRSGSYFTYDLPFGKMSIASEDNHITAIQFSDVLEGHGARQSSGITDLAAHQLEEYFNGKRKIFELALNPVGSPFQKSVWTALEGIPYGSTKSYKQVAELIGNPNASRAVGMANNKNPILIVIPCHRVVGADGALVGYAASLEIKKRLLDLEQLNLGE